MVNTGNWEKGRRSERFITEEAEIVNIGCSVCGETTDEKRVKEAQDLMKELPSSYDPNCKPEIVTSKLFI